MRILIIGGTVFVGRHITEAAIAAGHEVTVFHRGRSGADLFPEVTHLTGDRNADLSALEGSVLATGEWDATIDVCAYFPRQVAMLADALGGRGGRYVYISSTSAYKTPVSSGFDEDAPLAELADPATEEITDETYGGLKVACERLAAELFGEERITVVRPTYVVGPHDYSGRFTWWVERIARGGHVLAPGPKDGPIQVIDARDMGRWIVSLAERAVAGTFHAVSPAPPFGFGDMLEAIAAEVGPSGTKLTWVDADFLIEFGENAESIPLWPGGDSESDINTADPSRAYAAGLAPRPLSQTIAEVHAAELAAPTPPRAGVGLAQEREAELLAAWHAIQEAGPHEA
jgi:nucleoside-diphosphate-sugar epimerase